MRSFLLISGESTLSGGTRGVRSYNLVRFWRSDAFLFTMEKWVLAGLPRGSTSRGAVSGFERSADVSAALHGSWSIFWEAECQEETAGGGLFVVQPLTRHKEGVF